MQHQFTLIVEGPDLQSSDAIDALFEAGCDDALVGRMDGVQYVDFDREADSFEEAVLGAVGAIESAVPGSHIVRLAAADVVSLSDIAERTRRTRESVRLLVSGKRGPGGFPSPVTDPRTRYRLWHWPEVARWFHDELAVAVDDAPLVASALNALLEWRYAARLLTPAQRSALEPLASAKPAA